MHKKPKSPKSQQKIQIPLKAVLVQLFADFDGFVSKSCGFWWSVWKRHCLGAARRNPRGRHTGRSRTKEHGEGAQDSGSPEESLHHNQIQPVTKSLYTLPNIAKTLPAPPAKISRPPRKNQS